MIRQLFYFPSSNIIKLENVGPTSLNFRPLLLYSSVATSVVIKAIVISMVRFRFIPTPSLDFQRPLNLGETASLILSERLLLTNLVQHFHRQHQEVCELYKELSSTVPPKDILVSSHWIHYDCTLATGHNNHMQPVTTKTAIIIMIFWLLKPQW